MRAAIFFDRDGTLIEDRHYLSKPDGVALFPGVAAALRKLIGHGFDLFVVSNQSGVGRGYFTMADVEKVNERMFQEFASEGVSFKKTYIAPEAPGVPSRGRKPSPQFIFDARDEFKIDLGRSWMVGDKLIDLETGWNAGMQNCILVRTGSGARTFIERPELIEKAYVVDDVCGAVELVLKQIEPLPSFRSGSV